MFYIIQSEQVIKVLSKKLTKQTFYQLKFSKTLQDFNLNVFMTSQFFSEILIFPLTNVQDECIGHSYCEMVYYLQISKELSFPQITCIIAKKIEVSINQSSFTILLIYLYFLLLFLETASQYLHLTIEILFCTSQVLVLYS